MFHTRIIFSENEEEKIIGIKSCPTSSPIADPLFVTSDIKVQCRY